MTDLQRAYRDMERVALLLLSRLGGEVAITERELDNNLQGKTISVRAGDPPSSGITIRMVDN